MNAGRKTTALAGFVILGLSPSYVDWMQEPHKRPQMVAFYAAGLTLIYFGILAG